MKQPEQLDMWTAPPPPRLKGIFIPGNVPSKKNGQTAINIPLKGARKCHSCGKMTPSRGMIVPSKQHDRYIKDSEGIYARLADDFRNLMKGAYPPYRIAFQFIRESRHQFDYVNATQTVQDIMVKHGWVEDDNADILIPVYIPYVYDKDAPGVIIAPIA